MEDPGQRRAEEAEPRDEPCDQDGAHSNPGKDLSRPADAGSRVKGDAAEKREDLIAPVATQPIPEEVAEQGGRRRHSEDKGKA